MYTWLKISHYKHTGRLRPHEYTSYLPLLLIVLVAGLVLTVSTVYAADPPPQAGSVGLSGIMPGAAPSVAATITSPTNQKHFTTSPINVDGNCPSGLLVEIFKNNVFAGSGICGDNGKFSISIDLLFGKNTLIARVYDALNQPGPDSNSVTVYYDVLPGQSAGLAPLDFGGTQLILITDAVYRGSFPGQQLNVPVTILGGQEPYALEVKWGDTNNKIVPRGNNQPFNVTHAYEKPGTYQLTLQATDSQSRVAFLTVAAIINGQPAISATTQSAKQTLNKLFILWPLLAIAITAVISFWIGEKREKKIIEKSAPLIENKV